MINFRATINNPGAPIYSVILVLCAFPAFMTFGEMAEVLRSKHGEELGLFILALAMLPLPVVAYWIYRLTASVRVTRKELLLTLITLSIFFATIAWVAAPNEAYNQRLNRFIAIENTIRDYEVMSKLNRMELSEEQWQSLYYEQEARELELKASEVRSHKYNQDEWLNDWWLWFAAFFISSLVALFAPDFLMSDE